MAYTSKPKKTSQTLRSFINFRRSDTPIEINEEEIKGDVMTDARYLRQSSSLIADALQKGFDVLQLANGDIVTTGTKTVVHKYAWDDDRGKLTRTSSTTGTRRRGPGARGEDDEENSENSVEELEEVN